MTRQAKSTIQGFAITLLAALSIILLGCAGLFDAHLAWADEAASEPVQIVQTEEQETTEEAVGQAPAEKPVEVETIKEATPSDKLAPTYTVTIVHKGASFTFTGEVRLADMVAVLGAQVDLTAISSTSSKVEIATIGGELYLLAKADGTAYLNIASDGKAVSIDDVEAIVKEPVEEPALRAAADDETVDPHQKAREDNEALDEPVVRINERAESWSFEDWCWVEFRNQSQTDDVFYIWYDNEWQEDGVCINPGLPAPADGWYLMHANWNGESFDCWVETEDAEVHWNQVDIGQGCQNVGGFKIYAKPKIQISKESTCPEISSDVSGAQYGVFYYLDQAKELRDPMYILTIEDDGQSGVLDVSEPGDWYLREWVAPQGFALDPTVYILNVAPTGVATARFTDTPINDPNTIKIVKEVANPDEAGNMGESTLALAEYTFEYYAADYESIEEARASGAPTRTWVMRTNEKGVTSLTRGDLSFEYNGQIYDYKVSGDEFYTAYGFIVLPLGTIIVHETKAPEGFELSDELFFARLVSDGNGGYEWIGEKIMVDPQDATATVRAGETQKRYGVEIYKQIQGVAGETSPEGIQFEIVDEGTSEVAATLTLDENGIASTANDALVYGTYIIREVESTLPKTDDGEYLIQPYSETSGTGSNVIATIDLTAHEALEVIHVDCVDYASEHATGKKRDSDTHEGVPETEFTIWKLDGTTMTDGVVNEDETKISSDDPRWKLVRSVWSDENGDFDFGYLTYGIYKVDETSTNIDYMTSAESYGLEVDADTARIFKLDKNNPYTEQEWLNRRIIIECTVDKSTIDVTSAAFEYITASADGESISNVGVEKYKYEVAFDNGGTNTFADEYWVVDQMNFVDEPYGLRMTDLWLPVVVNDKDGKVWLLWKTNESEGNVPEGMTFAQPELNEGSLCDGTMRFDATGWMLIGQYDATSPECIDLGSFLAEGEYITELALCYGAVDPGFTTIDGAPLTYLVTATHALPADTVIPNTAESHISRNWAKVIHTPDGDIERDQPEGLTDDDEDSVETRVIETFTTSFAPYVGEWGSSWYKTGDAASNSILPITLIAFMICAYTCAFFRKEV